MGWLSDYAANKSEGNRKMTTPHWSLIGFGMTTDGREFGEIEIDALGVMLRVYPLGPEYRAEGRLVSESGPKAAARIVERMNGLEARLEAAEQSRDTLRDAVREVLAKWPNITFEKLRSLVPDPEKE